MKVGLLLEDIYFNGGGERVATNIANYLSNSFEIEIAIINLGAKKTKPIFWLNDKVAIYYLNVKGEGHFYKLFNKVKSLYRVNSFLSVNTFDIVLGIGTYPSVLLGLILNRGREKRIGCEHNSFDSVSKLWALLRRISYPRLSYLISLTNKDLPKLKKLNYKACVIPNSNSFVVENPAPLKNKIILTIGRFSYQKGFDYLIDVAYHFCKHNKDWNFKIIGDGPLKMDIKKEILKKGLSTRIQICPLTLNVLEEYLTASVFLLTSRYEGLPMVLLEAQACGLPIVSFDCNTGPSDIITHEVDGYLIDNFDIIEMADVLLHLTKDKKKIEQLGSNAFISSRRFSDEIVYGKWLSLFNELVP